MIEILSAEFQEKVKTDLKIQDLTIDNVNNIALQHYYFQLYINHKSKLFKIEYAIDKTYKELFNYYRYEFNKELRANEIDYYIKADEKFRKVKELYQKVELEVNYLEEVTKMFKDRNWSIKNAIELQKLQK